MPACIRPHKKKPEGRKKVSALLRDLNSLRVMHYAGRKRQTKVGKGG